MRAEAKPTFAVIFLHRGMRYSLRESAEAVAAMEPWMIDELAELGESAKRGNCMVVYRDSSRVHFVLDEAYARRYPDTFELPDFTPAPRSCALPDTAGEFPAPSPVPVSLPHA
jgi:hypothetical protein